MNAVNCSILVLFEPSASFDTVDHDILTEHLERYLGIRGIALHWFISYIKHRSFTVNIGTSSTPATVTAGVPQGSNLGPLLFSLYMLSLGQFENTKLHFIFMQLYLPLSKGDEGSIQMISDCIIEVKRWMVQFFCSLMLIKLKSFYFDLPSKLRS